jgi:hypothetical protein
MLVLAISRSKFYLRALVFRRHGGSVVFQIKLLIGTEAVCMLGGDVMGAAGDWTEDEMTYLIDPLEEAL